MIYTIYKITNKINGKVYVGKHQTNDLNDAYMGSGKMLRRAQEKYGVQNFIKEILHVFNTEEEMNAKEKELVTEEFCLRKDTYNICVGGQGGFGYINQNKLNLYGRNGQSGYGLENLAIGRKTKFQKMKDIPEYREWICKNTSNALKEYYKHNPGKFTGKQHTEDTKKKIGKANSIAQSGKRNSQFGSVWITDGSANKKIKTVDNIPEGWYKGRVIKK